MSLQRGPSFQKRVRCCLHTTCFLLQLHTTHASNETDAFYGFFIPNKSLIKWTNPPAQSIADAEKLIACNGAPQKPSDVWSSFLTRIYGPLPAFVTAGTEPLLVMFSAWEI